jgi:hypothetical protein
VHYEKQEVMSNGQHNLVRVIAVAVLVALHWFPHTHAAPLFASASTGNTATTPIDQANGERASGAEPTSVATIP